MSPSEKAKAIIEKVRYLTVATVSDKGEPWNAPVFGAYDADYNFYFGTARASQKAQNIAHNKNVFLIIYDSSVTPGTGEGVYIKGVAEEVKDQDEIKNAHKLLDERHITPYWKPEQFLGDTPIVMYKVVPQKVWINDEDTESGSYIDFRTEVDLFKKN